MNVYKRRCKTDKISFISISVSYLLMRNFVEKCSNVFLSEMLNITFSYHGRKEALPARRSDDQSIKCSVVILEDQKGYGDSLTCTIKFGGLSLRKRKRDRKDNRDCSDHEDSPKAEAYSRTTSVSPEHGTEDLVSFVRRLVAT
ncbi:conserved hypothetical protein [Trichinella spiralis]|uniref:hypothetical protein n=1 Tax=Trichinella spiralis TaxID=6334 RepID=UPI0001EFD20C|nr:conserved hypothetical protein [Trichinella spiralis]